MPRPTAAPADVTGRIASIGPIAKCLESAITQLKDEEDSMSSLNLFDDAMKQLLLKKYADAVTETNWEDRGSKDSCTPIPPAGVIQGKLDYYNRAGTQWRIVLSDAELRPRSSCDDSVRVKNGKSLWDQSGQSQSTHNHPGTNESIKLNHVIIFAYDDV
jgi:hypothetical protein